MMKSYLYRLLLVVGILFTSSCVKQQPSEAVATVDPFIIHDTLYMSQEEWDEFSAELLKRNKSAVILYDTTVVLYDTTYVTKEQWKRAEKINEIAEVEKEKLGESSVASVKTTEFTEVKRYNVVVASLAKEEGVKRLKAAFDQEGIKYIVVKNNSGSLSQFVIYSADTREAAVAARKKFMEKYGNKSSGDIWKQFGITLRDSYIWEKK